MTQATGRIPEREPQRLFRTLLFTAGLLAALRLAAFCATTLAPLESTAYGRQDRRRVTDLLRDPSQVETLVLGNSHAGAIDAATLGPSAQVLPRGYGDIFEMRLYAAALLPRLSRVEHLYITISPFTLDWDNAADEALKIRRIHAYSALPSWTFRKGDAFSLMVGKVDPWIGVTQVLRGDSWKGVLLGALGRQGSVDAGLRSDAAAVSTALSAVDNCPHRSDADLDRHARRRAQEVATTVAAMAAQRLGIRSTALSALDDIIAMAQEQGVAVTLFTPPYWRRYATELGRQLPSLVSDNGADLRRISARWHVPYLDHSADSRFVDDASAFSDSDHLNPCGAAGFTLLFLAEQQGQRPPSVR